jgi:hypothetical protein
LVAQVVGVSAAAADEIIAAMVDPNFRRRGMAEDAERTRISPPALREFRLVDKRTPARVLRYLLRYLTWFFSRAVSLPAGWDVAIREPKEIP